MDSTAKNKVLVVDDEPVNREIMAEILDGQCSLEFAINGTEGIGMALANVPDLVLLDVMMPGLDGYETCRRMREAHVLRHTKIILVSAKASLAERIRGYDAGADDYVVKPFDHDELMAKVRVFMRLKRTEEVDELKSDVLTLLRHETRTPMTGILATAQLLAESTNLPAGELHEWSQMLYRDAKRLNEFLEVGTLLCAYKAGRIGLTAAKIDLQAVVRGALEGVEIQPESGIRIIVTESEPAGVMGNEEHLQRAVRFLVQDAVQRSPRDGQVDVAMGLHRGRVLLAVRVRGVSIDPSMLPRMFDGVRAPDIMHHSGLPGLDLALARAVVQNHGGDISVASEPNLGTCFTISLPSSCATGAAEASVERAATARHL